MVDVQRRRAVDPITMKTSTDPHDTMTARWQTRRRRVLAITVICLLASWSAAAVVRGSPSASQAAQHVG